MSKLTVWRGLLSALLSFSLVALVFSRVFSNAFIIASCTVIFERFALDGPSSIPSSSDLSGCSEDIFGEGGSGKSKEIRNKVIGKMRFLLHARGGNVVGMSGIVYLFLYRGLRKSQEK